MRSLILAAAVAAAFASPASAATRNFGVTSFEKIRLEGPFKVTLRTGVAPFARASGSQAALDRVSIEVQGTTLVVRNRAASWGGDSGRDPGNVEIALGTHDLSSVVLSGAGTLAIDRVKGLTFALSAEGSGGAEIADVKVDQLTVAVLGTASVAMAGKATKLSAQLRGVASLAAGQLAAHDATIGVDGSATVEASVSDTVTVNATGPATVRLGGRPACTLKVTGSASVSGCR
ncbi:MAG: DUF2807 domain-containing protein [Sphingomicrobium sp.]